MENMPTDVIDPGLAQIYKDNLAKLRVVIEKCPQADAPCNPAKELARNFIASSNCQEGAQAEMKTQTFEEQFSRFLLRNQSEEQKDEWKDDDVKVEEEEFVQEVPEERPSMLKQNSHPMTNVLPDTFCTRSSMEELISQAFTSQDIKAERRNVEAAPQCFSDAASVRNPILSLARKNEGRKSDLFYEEKFSEGLQKDLKKTKKSFLRGTSADCVSMADPTENWTHQCTFCLLKFTHKSRWTDHVRTHTGAKPFTCEYCSSRFAKKGDLTRHIRTHTGEKPYKCVYCSASFSQSNHLVSHTRSHTGEKPYRCGSCSARFADKSRLIVHIRTHTGERSFKCDSCSARFAKKCDLARHIRAHTGERPYKCQFCPAKFVQNSHLGDHVRIHTGERPFKCESCSTGYVKKSDLVRHLRTRHGGIHSK